MSKNNCDDIQRLSARLSRVFFELFTKMHVDKYLHMSDWLTIAAGIKCMDFEWNRYDLLCYCSSAGEYEDAKGELLANVVKELTVFSYVWGCLETLIDLITPKTEQKRLGKINAICNYLKTKYEPFPVPNEYVELLAELYKYEDQTKDQNKSRSEKHIVLSSKLGISGVGLKMVYRLRNRFAHGALAIPEPSNWMLNQVDHARAINKSSKIILLSIQMILIGYFRDENIVIEYITDPGNFVEIQLINLLRIIFSEYDEIDDSQITLFE